MNAIIGLWEKFIKLLENIVSKMNAAFMCAALLGLGGLIAACIHGKDNYSTILMIALAAFAVGSIIGFLFGIPRTLQKSSSDDGRTEIMDNTNLEQISDWLTKIMVGVGLTQLKEIKAGFYEISFNAGKAISGSEAGSAGATTFAGAILIFFALDGFLMSYLWARLILAAIQKRSYKEELIEVAKEQDDNNQTAISTAYKQLNNSSGFELLTSDEIYNYLKQASGKTIGDIYIMAVNYRKNNWRQHPENLEKIVPIFEALIMVDSDNKFPENYSQLGYVLKDKSNPDYLKAVRNFDKAIAEFRKKDIVQGLSMIHFNKALSLILLDANFKAGAKSNEAEAKIITESLTEAAKNESIRKIFDETEVVDWMRINDVVL